ncbi:MAG: hypothetical protein IT428_33415 [Planctomycetaceae bacterium]|nr:hypothetical protein [Planctomycetaceae bacterium]
MSMFKTYFSKLMIALIASLAFAASALAQESYVVEFRLPKQRSAHFDDPREASQFGKDLQRLGCDVRTENHGEHLDVTYRCPQWRSIEASSDAAAHRWEGWLKSQGFETSHRH